MSPQQLLLVRLKIGEPQAEVLQPGKVEIRALLTQERAPFRARALQAQELGVQQGDKVVQAAGGEVVHQLRIIEDKITWRHELALIFPSTSR